MVDNEITLKVEALLFAYGDWLSLSDIMQALGIDSSKVVESSLRELEGKYNEKSSFHIVKGEDSRWKMTLHEEYEDIVSELVSGVEIPRNVLKVLSVIAYEQPVTKTRLNEILGKAVKQEVDYLFKAKFVNYEKVGIGKYYRVTKKFYDYFKIDEDEFTDKVKENLGVYLKEPSEESGETPEKEEE